MPSLYHLFHILTYAIPITGTPGTAYSAFSLQLRSDFLHGAIAPDFHSRRLAIPSPRTYSLHLSFLICSLVIYSSIPTNKIQTNLCKNLLLFIILVYNEKESIKGGTLCINIYFTLETFPSVRTVSC